MTVHNLKRGVYDYCVRLGGVTTLDLLGQLRRRLQLHPFYTNVECSGKVKRFLHRLV